MKREIVNVTDVSILLGGATLLFLVIPFSLLDVHLPILILIEIGIGLLTTIVTLGIVSYFSLKSLHLLIPVPNFDENNEKIQEKLQAPYTLDDWFVGSAVLYTTLIFLSFSISTFCFCLIQPENIFRSMTLINACPLLFMGAFFLIRRNDLNENIYYIPIFGRSLLRGDEE
jgi:hypothetical protein